jgi:hypothetical protein
MLTKSEKALVASIISNGFDYGQAVWDATVKAVGKAYVGKDNGELAQAVFTAVLAKDKPAVLARFRACGLNVTKEGPNGVRSIIGGPLDYKRQDAAIKTAKATPPLAMADSSVKERAPRKEKPLVGFADERAKSAFQKTVGSLVKRLKETDPDAAVRVNEMIQDVGWKETLRPLAECHVTDDEVQHLMEYLIMLRTINFDPEQDVIELKPVELAA